MWRKSVRVSNDFDKARSEAHLLVQNTRVTKQTPEMLAFDVAGQVRRHEEQLRVPLQ